MARGWRSEILRFWFEEIGPDHFWTRSDAADAKIRERFGALWEEKRGRDAADFLSSPEEALAAVILFDQFSRNLHRGEARAFKADALALAIAKRAIDRGYDAEMDMHQRQFLYMPLMHSEDIADQDRSVVLFAALGDEKAARYAVMHRDLIARFGRFPHRNAALGRETLPEEQGAVREGAGW